MLDIPESGGGYRTRGKRAMRVGGAGSCLAAVAWVLPWRPGIVVGESMRPTLPPGRVFLYDRRGSRKEPLRRGEIVLFQERGEVWVKRVYAAGGDSFWALRQRAGDETHVDPISSADLGRFRTLAAHLHHLARRDCDVVRVTVPRGKLFLVGDGIWSRDSRQLGMMSATGLRGRVIACPGSRLAPGPRVERIFPSRRDAVAYSERMFARARAEQHALGTPRRRGRRGGGLRVQGYRDRGKSSERADH